MSRNTGWVVWCVCLAIVVAGAVAAQERGYIGGRFAFVLDGQSQGFVKQADGGQVKGEVATVQSGESLFMKKHLSTLTVEPLTVEVGMEMAPTYYDWIRTTLDGESRTRNASIVACDYEGRAISARELLDVVITEVAFPALDPSSREPASLTVTMQPERIRYTKGDGGTMASPKTATKTWLASNFQIEVGDLPTSRVAKIDSFTWKRELVEDVVGASREPTRAMGQIWVPNLKLTISSADLKPWVDWHRSFVIDGKADDSAEKSGKIELLSSDLATVLGTIELLHVGLISLQTEKAATNKDEVARFTVELYVEQMKFSVAK